MPADTQYLFASPEWLYAIPLLLACLLLRRRRGSSGSIDHPTVRFVRIWAQNPDSLAGRLGAFLFVLGTIALAVALARPQIHNSHTYTAASGIDIMIAFDLSGSMEATDMDTDKSSNRISRLRAAQEVVDQFIEQRPNDRLGVVAFAALTKACSPLTLDHRLVRQIVRRFHLNFIPADGTAIGSAIALAATRLSERKDTKSKIIILVTDGANNTGELSPIEAAREAAKLGVRIYTIAIGSDEDPRMPYMRNIDAFDEKTLKEIARITGGEHFRASNSPKLEAAFGTIDKLEKTEAKKRNVVTTQELFIYALMAAAAFLAAGLSLNILRPHPAP